MMRCSYIKRTLYSLPVLCLFSVGTTCIRSRVLVWCCESAIQVLKVNMTDCSPISKWQYPRIYVEGNGNIFLVLSQAKDLTLSSPRNSIMLP